MVESKWILKTLRLDFLSFYLPGFLVVALTYFIRFDQNSTIFIILAWLALGLLDSGHVYTTVWRTYFNPNEFSRRKNYYLLAPLLVFAGFFVWMFFKVPYLGAFVAYFTIYHNLRQFYGMSKWYQKINKSFNRISDNFLYLLCFITVVTAHFRSDLEWASYYADSGIFMYPSEIIKTLIYILFLLVLGCWVSYEFFKAHKDKKWEIPRILSVAFPVGLYAYCFIYSTSIAGILFPLVVSHGLSYIVLIGDSSKKLKLIGSPLKISLMVSLTAVILGSLEFYFDGEVSDLYSESLLSITLVAVVLTPLFCHYIYDAFLWRSDHPEAHQIIN